METLIGLRHPVAGTVRLGDQDISSWSTRERREAGIGYIPEDRQRHGLLLDSPLWENRILGHQTRPPSVKGGWLDVKGARKDSERIVATYDVRTPGIDTTARALSGGNQQKFIVGREMSGDPVLLIASHPTRGVDVGAQAQIWEHIKRARRDGLAVLLISADLDELIGLSDTIRVLLRGRLVGTFDPQTVTPQELGSAMTGAGEDCVSLRQADRAGRWLPRSSPSSWPAVVASVVLLVTGDDVGAFWDVMFTLAAAPQHRRHPEHRVDPLPVGGRRRDRLPDEPVQHRGRGPVPPRRASPLRGSPGRPGCPGR